MTQEQKSIYEIGYKTGIIAGYRKGIIHSILGLGTIIALLILTSYYHK